MKLTHEPWNALLAVDRARGYLLVAGVYSVAALLHLSDLWNPALWAWLVQLTVLIWWTAHFGMPHAFWLLVSLTSILSCLIFGIRDLLSRSRH